MFPRHPGTINTSLTCERGVWSMHALGVLLSYRTSVAVNLDDRDHYWLVQLWGSRISPKKSRHQPLPKPLTQRTSPSPFLLSSHAWNHQNLDLKPPFFRQQNAKMRGGHNRFPTSDVLNSKCLVDAPVGLISVSMERYCPPTPTFEMMGLTRLGFSK